jgi:hypothetical protein
MILLSTPLFSHWPIPLNCIINLFSLEASIFKINTQVDMLNYSKLLIFLRTQKDAKDSNKD